MVVLFSMNFLIAEVIIIEIKSAEVMNPIFEVQLIPYLKLADKRLGYLINFNVTLLTNGFKRMVNRF